MMSKRTRKKLLQEYNACINNTSNEPTEDDWGNMDSIDGAERRGDLKGRPWEIEVVDSNGNTCGYAYTSGHTRDGRPYDEDRDNLL